MIQLGLKILIVPTRQEDEGKTYIHHLREIY